MPRVVHFEIGADNMERAEKFYSDIFDWKFQKWDGSEEGKPYFLITTGANSEPGINGGMFPRQGPIYSHINTIDVPAIDEYLERIVAAGGEVVMQKMPIAGVGYLAYCHDTEGNFFGIMQMDESAGK